MPGPSRSVYGWWQVVHGPPLLRITLAEARQLVEAGLAESCKHGKAVKLVRAAKPKKYDLRGQSCQMKAWLIRALAETYSEHLETIREAWRFFEPVTEVTEDVIS